jgi:PAS domain S-box-containing protein
VGTTSALPGDGAVRQTLDRSHLLVLRLDDSGAITYCNDHFLLHTGWDRKEVIGRDWAGKFLAADVAEKVGNAVREALSGAEGPRAGCFPIHFEVPVLCRDGEWRTVGWSHLVEYDGEGRAAGTLLLGEDLTDFRRREGTRRREDRFNRVLLDNLPCPSLLLKRRSYEIVAANRAALREGALVGDTCFRSWRKRSSPCPWCMAPALWSSGKSQELTVEEEGRVLDTHWVPEEGELHLHYAFDVTESLRVAESLRRSEERYRVLFDEAPVPMMDVDLSGTRKILAEVPGEGPERFREHFRLRPEEIVRCIGAARIRDANREAARLYGVPGKEALLGDLGRLFTADTYRAAVDSLEELAAGSRTVELEAPTRLGNGRARIVSAWLSIPPGHGESWSRSILILQDVTARRDAERSLLESERLFRDTFDLSGAAIVYMAPGGRFLSANRRYCEMVGYGREELLGMTFLEITHPEDRPADKDAYRRLAAGEVAAVSNEKRYLRKDGSVLWANRIVGAVRDSGGAVRYFVGVLEDISERKRMEEALRESEARFRSLVETTTDWIWRIDARGRYTYSSPKVREILGYEPEELRGRTPFSLMPPAEARRVRPLFRKISEGRLPISADEAVHLRKDGVGVVLETKGVPILDGAGRLAGYQGVGRDVSDRKRVEEELRRLSERTRAAVEEEQRRISREIHDILGQGLIGLRLDTTWLSEGLLDSQGELREKAADMVREIDGVIRTVKRITGELRPPLLDDLGLGAAIEWHAEEFRRRCGIPCEVALSPRGIAAGGAVSIALFRIFQEALTNVVRHARASRVRVRLARSAGTVTLVVRDDGAGFPPELAADPTSLGLLGMRERALPFGGTVRIRTAIGKGTAVMVRIPPAAPTARTGGTEER